MVLAQMESARICYLDYDGQLAALTAAGTMTIYGADRQVERLALKRIAKRHLPGRFDPYMILLIAVLIGFGSSAIPDRFWWLLTLGTGGFLYLTVTVGRLRAPLLFKELLGAMLFSLIVWGWQDTPDHYLLLAFLPLALANFMFSSNFDRARDAANGIRSMAVLYPETNMVIARCAAFFTCGFFFVMAPGISAFMPVAMMHALWSNDEGSVDICFFWLLAVPFLF